MSTPTDLEHDLRRTRADLVSAADLTVQIQEHPRFAELAAAAETPDHPALRLAAQLEDFEKTPLVRALWNALDWMNSGGDDLRAALREYDGDADALGDDLDSIRDRLEGTDE